MLHLAVIFIGTHLISQPPEFGIQERSMVSVVELVASSPLQETQEIKPELPIEEQMPDPIIPVREKRVIKPKIVAQEKIKTPPQIAQTEQIKNLKLENTGGKNSEVVKASPNYFQNPPPPYPESARRLHQEGLVVLAVMVNADGIPTGVSVLHSSGFTVLDNAALKAVQRWKFRAAMLAGIPIASRVEVPVRFRLGR